MTAATPSLWAAEVTRVAETALSWPLRRDWAAERVTVHALGWTMHVPGCDPRAWRALSLGPEALAAASPSPLGGRPGPLTRGILLEARLPAPPPDVPCSIFPEGSPPRGRDLVTSAVPPPPLGSCPLPLGGCSLQSSPRRCVSAPPGMLSAAVVSWEVCVCPSRDAVCRGRLLGGVCPPLPGGCLPWSSPRKCVSAPPGMLSAGVESWEVCGPPPRGPVRCGHLPGSV